MLLSGLLKAKTHLCITEAVMGVKGRLQEGGPAQTITGEGQLTN